VGKQAPSGEVQQPDAGMMVDAGAGPGPNSDAGTPPMPADGGSRDASTDATAPALPSDASLGADAGGAASSSDAGSAVPLDGGATPPAQPATGDAQTGEPADEDSTQDDGCALHRGSHGSRSGAGASLLVLLGYALASRRRRPR
ncbi:MAG TPA: hypothetical protein VFZ61_01530, partial [Polyangiales bacterium]